MKIREKIKQRSDNIRKNWCTTGKGEAIRLQNEAIAAMKQGMKKPADAVKDAWEEYMKNFATTPEQLQRLMGNDAEFMEKEWALPSLCYIVANGPCTEHSLANTLRNMDDEMLFGLDDDPVPQITETETDTNKSSGSEVVTDERKDI